MSSKNNIISALEAEQMTAEIPEFGPGDTVVVQVKVKRQSRRSTDVGTRVRHPLDRVGVRAAIEFLRTGGVLSSRKGGGGEERQKRQSERELHLVDNLSSSIIMFVAGMPGCASFNSL